jgi:hypothetical protein
MATEYKYYFILKNQDQKDLLSGTNDGEPYLLPGSDDLLFKNGFLDLDLSVLSEEALKKLNYKLKYKQSVYYKNQVLKDVSGPEEGEFNLVEPGYYKIELSGGGGDCDFPLNFLCYETSTAVDVEPKKYTGQGTWVLNNFDKSERLLFYTDYSWKIIDKSENIVRNEQNILLRGYYKLSNLSLFLFLGKQENSYFYENTFYKNRLDDNEQLYAYSHLFFDNKDLYNIFFRKIYLFFDNENDYKEYFIQEENREPISNQLKRDYKNIYPNDKNLINYGDILRTSDTDITKKEANWTYTYDVLNKLPIINTLPGGNSGLFYGIVKIDYPSKITYGIGSSELKGSYLQIKPYQGSDKNESLVIKVQSGKSNKKIPTTFDGKYVVDSNNFLKTFKQEKDFTEDPTIVGYDVDHTKNLFFNSQGEIRIYEKNTNFNINTIPQTLTNSNKSIILGSGLGSEGEGILRDFNNLNYRNLQEPGTLKIVYLGPINSSLVNFSYDFNLPVKSINLKNNSAIVLGTDIILKFMLNKFEMVDQENSYITIGKTKFLLKAYLEEDSKTNQLMNPKFDRISDSIYVFSFHVIDEITINFKIVQRIYSIKNNEKNIISEKSIFNYEKNKIGLNRTLFYLYLQNNKAFIDYKTNSDSIEIIELSNDVIFLIRENILSEFIVQPGNFLQLPKKSNDYWVLNVEDNNKYNDDNSIKDLKAIKNKNQNMLQFSSQIEDIMSNNEQTSGEIYLMRYYFNKNINFNKNKETKIIEFTTPGQIIFIQIIFNTYRIKIDNNSSIVVRNFIHHEGINIFSGKYLFEYNDDEIENLSYNNSFYKQSLILISGKADSYNLLNLTRRLYNVTFTSTQNNILNIIQQQTAYDVFEVCSFLITLSNYQKFSLELFRALINTKSYPILDYLDSELELFYSKRPETTNIYFDHILNELKFYLKEYAKSNQDDFKINIDELTNDSLLSLTKIIKLYYKNNETVFDRINSIDDEFHGYIRNLSEIIKKILSEQEILEISFFIKHSDLHLDIETDYLNNSVIFECLERTFKNLVIPQKGFYRISLAGGQSGDGGDGGDAGNSSVKAKNITTGRDDIYSDALVIGTIEMVKNGNNDYTLNIVFSKSLFAYLYDIVDLKTDKRESLQIKEKRFESFISKDTIMHALLNADLSEGANGSLGSQLINTDQILIRYDPQECFIEISNIKFKTGDGSLQGKQFSFTLELTAEENYISDSLQNTLISSSEYTNKGSYHFMPPEVIFEYKSSSGAVTATIPTSRRVTNSKTYAQAVDEFKKLYNSYFFNQNTTNNIRENFTYTQYHNEFKRDWRAQKISLSSFGSTAFNTLLHYHVGDAYKWPDLKSEPIKFPKKTSSNSTTDLGIIGNTFSSNYNGPQSNPISFGGNSGSGSSATSSGIPDDIINNNAFWQAEGDNLVGPFLMKSSDNTNPYPVDRSAINNKVFPVFCWHLQQYAAEFKGESYQVWVSTGGGGDGGDSGHYETHYRLKFHRDGLIMKWGKWKYYSNVLSPSNRNKTVWDITAGLGRVDIESDLMFGGGSSSSSTTNVDGGTTYKQEQVMKFGNGGGAGRAGSAFLEKAVDGTPGSATGFGSWPDRDFTATPTIVSSEKTGKIVGYNNDTIENPEDYNQLGGQGGLLAIESFVFGQENRELQENAITKNILKNKQVKKFFYQSQSDFLMFRGAFLDSIFYINGGNLIIETGGPGGKGGNASKAGMGEFGHSGGGGGAGAPSLLFFNQSEFFLYKSCYDDMFETNIDNSLFYDFPNNLRLKFSDFTKRTYFKNFTMSASENIKILMKNSFEMNKLFIACGGRAGDMFLIRDPKIMEEVLPYVDSPELKNKYEVIEKPDDPLFGGGGGGSSSSSTVVMDYNHAWVKPDAIFQTYMNWEYNGMPGGNGGSGYRGGKGGNGGYGVLGLSRKYNSPAPILQTKILKTNADQEKIISESKDLFGGGGGGSSSTTITTYTIVNYYPYMADDNEDLNWKNVKNYYYGRHRELGSSSITNDVANLYHSEKYYDPSTFMFDITGEQGNYFLVLKGSSISSKEIYQRIATNNKWVDYKTYRDFPEKQLIGYGGGWNSIREKISDTQSERKMSFSEIKLPFPDASSFWEHIAAGGTPAYISKLSLDYIMNYCKDSNNVVYINEKPIKTFSEKEAAIIKNYNVIIQNKLIPLEGAGCKITFLCKFADEIEIATDQNILVNEFLKGN